MYTRAHPARHFLKYFEVKCIKTLKMNSWSHNWNSTSEELSSGGNSQEHYELWSKEKWRNHVKQVLEGCDQPVLVRETHQHRERNRRRAKTERRALRQVPYKGSQFYSEIYSTPALGFRRRWRLSKWFAETTEVEMMPYVASWERTMNRMSLCLEEEKCEATLGSYRSTCHDLSQVTVKPCPTCEHNLERSFFRPWRNNSN